MTDNQKLLKVLKKEQALMHRAAEAMERSWEQCKNIIGKSKYSIEEIDHLELLSSRFSRLTDFMIQQIFRLIDELDLESPGTIRDVINRAEKKGLIENADSFIEARILRNRSAHEYVEKVMTEIFNEAIKLVPTLLNAVHRVDTYTKKYK